MPSYVLTGRGGAGNTHRLTKQSSPTCTPSIPSTPSTYVAQPSSASSTPRIVSSGVGGAGNIRAALSSESRSSAAQSLQADLHRAAARDRHPVGYAGRGGAGNAYAYAGSDDGASLLSGSSSGSSVERARGWAKRVSGSFARS